MADARIRVNLTGQPPTPRVGDELTTAAQLDACPVNTVVIGAYKTAWQRKAFHGWHLASGKSPETRTSEKLAAQVKLGSTITVVYVPGQPIPTVAYIDELTAARDQAAANARKAEGWARRRARDLSQVRAALAGIRTVNFELVDAPTMAEYGALIRNAVNEIAAQTDTPPLTGWFRIDDSPAPAIADHQRAAAKQNVAEVRSGFAGVRGGIRAGALAELGNYMRWIVELLPNEGDHLTISAKTFRELALEADELLVDRELQKAANRAADALQQQAESASTQRDAAYTERARLVAFLAALYPSRITAVDSPEWPIVTVLTPAGQMTWHISRTDVHLFAHVPTDADPTRQGDLWAWDNHTTDTKHERLAQLTQLTDRLRTETTHAPRIWAAGIGHADQAATPGYTTTPDAAQEQTRD